MALSAASSRFRPVLDGLCPAQGSIRLIGLRLALVVLSSLPALIVGSAGVASGAARRPYYTDVDGRLPLVHFLQLTGDLPQGFLPAAIAGVLFAVFADQVLTSGALSLLAPGRPVAARINVLSLVCREGITHLWAFLRAAALGLVISGVGVALIRIPFKRLDAVGYRGGWTSETMLLTLPMLSTVLILLWIATSGAWVFWCRLITAADGRRRVRRTGLLVLRVFWRHPLRSWGIFVALTLASTLTSGAVLIGWRQAEPGSVSGALGWSVAWLFTLLVQAFVWLWLLRSGRLLYATPGLADLRERSDAVFGLLALLAKLAWWQRKGRA